MNFISRKFSQIQRFSRDMKFIDIGANLTDGMYKGIYNGSQKHPADLNMVLKRSWSNGLEKIIITVGTVTDTEDVVKIAKKDDRLFFTMGCHPTRCNEFKSDPDKYYAQLCAAIDENKDKVVAIGECGLDYDRLHFCTADVQKTYFERQLDLVSKYRLPLFLHCRNSFDDFYNIIQRNLAKITNGGVCHSFDGTFAQAKKLIDLGFYIGINGCSLKSEKQLEVVAHIPNERILIETDCPWCQIRPSHAGSKFIKTKWPTTKKKEKWTEDTLIDGRYEPTQIIQVLEVLAGCKNENIDVLADQIYENTMHLFFN
ncbi:uncharacterized protein LOC116346608 isoform X2 [Contarinia nasturtii]|uniref:uncharacterized protein LOC116346608 isoform X2 n=1 Tax=Contarinia nasturtii TaxID=265458 RepID=UPI0012D47F9D|nr:uncharacterized protein LOC116346608 isoform X2 [Contarinia nasturtii]